MPITDNKIVYKQHEDGSIEIVEQTTVEIPSPAEVIAEKEAQLLQMYEELKALKGE